MSTSCPNNIFFFYYYHHYYYFCVYRLAECLHPLNFFFCSGSSSSSLTFDVCVCDLSLAKWIVPYCLFWVNFFFLLPLFPLFRLFYFSPFHNYHISSLFCPCRVVFRSRSFLYHFLFPRPPSSFLYYYSDIRLLLFCELMLIKCSYVKRISGGVLL